MVIVDGSVLMLEFLYGSVLGPLIFILFIKDLVECCSNYCDIHIFADDVKLHRHTVSQAYFMFSFNSISAVSKTDKAGNIVYMSERSV